MVLSCVADGIPVPSVNWKKDGVPLTNSMGRYTTVPFGDLIVDNTVVSFNLCNMLKIEGTEERIWSLFSYSIMNVQNKIALNVST